MNIKNTEKGDLTIDSTENTIIDRDLYTCTGNLEEMDRFQNAYKTDSQRNKDPNEPTISSKIKRAVKSPSKEGHRPDGLPAKFYQAFKEVKQSFKFFRKIEKEEILVHSNLQANQYR